MVKVVDFLLVFFIGIYSSFLLYSGNIGLYINPRYFLLSELASIVCLFVGAFGTFYFFKHSNHDIKFNKKYIFKFIKNYFLFFCFFLVVVIFAPQTLSSKVASDRSFNSDSFFSTEKDSIFSIFKKNDEDFTILDWYNEINSNENYTNFVGRNVNVIGFVYRDLEDSENEFRVGRFIIRCCIVDATPISLVVKSGDAKNIENNSWVRVKGSFINDSGVLKVEAETIEKVEKPDSPYFY
jgi:putative membrane protein